MASPDWLFNRSDEGQGILRRLGPGLTARVFAGDNSMLSIVRIDPHSQGKIHSHPEEQWGVLLEGECVRIQGGQETKVTAGDFWHTPANAPHGIRTGEIAALILDIFSPPRAEYRVSGIGTGSDPSDSQPTPKVGTEETTLTNTIFGSTPIEHRERTYEISYFIRPGTQGTVIYLHGLGSSKEDFLAAREVPELDDRTLVAFDFPGCGESSTYYPEIALGIDDLVAVTYKLVTKLELRDLAVIGQSLGGLTALQSVHWHPELIAHFVNVEGNLAPEDCDIQSRDVFQYRFLGDEDKFFRRVKQRLSNPEKPDLVEFAGLFRENIVDRAYFDYCRSIVDYSDGVPLLEQFIGLPCPKLFVHGEANSHLSYLPSLAKNGVPVVSVPGADHFPAQSNHDFYYDAISRFVDGRPLEHEDNATR